MRVAPWIGLKVTTATATDFCFLNLDLEFLIRVQSIEPLHTKIPPIILAAWAGGLCVHKLLFRQNVPPKMRELHIHFMFGAVWCFQTGGFFHQIKARQPI
jgi:hypothetical protein